MGKKSYDEILKVKARKTGKHGEDKKEEINKCNK
jgi:hypothetical protein